MEIRRFFSARLLQRTFLIYFYSSRNLQLVGTYFPFNRADKPTSPNWGEFKWMNLTDMNFQDNYLFRKFENLNGFRLRVSMFPRYPTALLPEELPDVFLSSYFMNVLNESGGYGGIDGLLLGNMAKALNFSAVVIAPNGSDFGYRLNTGIFIGMLWKLRKPFVDLI